MLLIGDKVRGGVYGDMFPMSEVSEGRYEESGADIVGKTSFIKCSRAGLRTHSAGECSKRVA